MIVMIVMIVVFVFGFILQVDVIVYVIPKIGEASEESVLLERKGQIDVISDFTFQVHITDLISSGNKVRAVHEHLYRCRCSFYPREAKVRVQRLGKISADIECKASAVDVPVEICGFCGFFSVVIVIMVVVIVVVIVVVEVLGVVLE